MYRKNIWASALLRKLMKNHSSDHTASSSIKALKMMAYQVEVLKVKKLGKGILFWGEKKRRQY